MTLENVNKFLRELTLSTSDVDSTNTKIIQLKLKNRLIENRKKVQQSMKRKTEKLVLIEQEIANNDLNITELTRIKSANEETKDMINLMDES
jgi:hypothetical protein